MLLTLFLNASNVAIGATTFTFAATHDVVRATMISVGNNTDSVLPLFVEITEGLATNTHVLDGTIKIENALPLDVDQPLTLLNERQQLGSSLTLQLFELQVAEDGGSVSRVDDIDSIFSDETMHVVLVLDLQLAHRA